MTIEAAGVTSAVAELRPRSRADADYLPTLDGWRAIAVSLVIGAHSVGLIEATRLPGSGPLSALLKHAGYGVDIFFALSGFLITTLLLAEKEKKSSINLGGFYVRRVFRIIPPMAVYLAVVLAIIPAVSEAEVVYSLLFVRNYAGGSWYTGHFWSLSIEEHFYAVVPLLLLMLRGRVLAIVTISMIVCCILIRWYEFNYLNFSNGLPQFRTENRVDALLWGSLVAQLVRRPFWRARLVAVLHPALIAALIILSIVMLSNLESASLRRTIVAFVLPLIIVSTVLRPNSILGRVLELRAIRYIGRLSYSLYIWQMMFLGVNDRPLGIMQEAPLAIVLPFILAYLSYNVVEKPSIRMGHRLSKMIQEWRDRRALLAPA